MYKKRDMITKIVAIVILLGLLGSVFASVLI